MAPYNFFLIQINNFDLIIPLIFWIFQNSFWIRNQHWKKGFFILGDFQTSPPVATPDSEAGEFGLFGHIYPYAHQIGAYKISSRLDLYCFLSTLWVASSYLLWADFSSIYFLKYTKKIWGDFGVSLYRHITRDSHGNFKIVFSPQF